MTFMWPGGGSTDDDYNADDNTERQRRYTFMLMSQLMLHKIINCACYTTYL